jgi:hypothetical protein
MRTRLLAIGLLAAANSAQGQKGTACPANVAAQPWAKSQREWLDDKAKWSDDTLRQALVGAAGLDLSKPLALQWGALPLESAPELTGTDAMGAIALLKTRAATRGSVWPTKSVVGAAGVRAVFLLALQDSALSATTVRRMMEAGPDESFRADVATLEDRMRAKIGRGTLHGAALRDGKPARIEDSTHVDIRREEAWLPPIKQAVCGNR